MMQGELTLNKPKKALLVYLISFLKGRSSGSRVILLPRLPISKKDSDILGIRLRLQRRIRTGLIPVSLFSLWAP